MSDSPPAALSFASRVERVLALVLLAALPAGLFLWLARGPAPGLSTRVPGMDRPAGEPVAEDSAGAGTLVRFDGVPADLAGAWPCFRGARGDGIADDPTPLARSWGPGEPRVLWSVELGEGYAGPAVRHGCVYVLDYDLEARADAYRCFSLADGREIWRWSYPVKTKRNHGMSRTVPAVTGRHVIGLGPKCHVNCLDARTGERVWALDLVRDFGAAVPQWYAGQCPLVDGDRVILAPGGKDALLMAVEVEGGQVVWRTPNPRGWAMTHSSIAIMPFEDRRTYVYCGKGGVVGVDAADGRILWETTEWKIGIATIATPVPLPGNRIFLSGGYEAGSLMLRLEREGDGIAARPEFRLKPEVFGATQHTPIAVGEHLYGIRPDGQLVCLDLAGRGIWESGAARTFGLGPLLVAQGRILALSENGKLTMAEAAPAGFRLLAEAQVLHGREAWAPLALADGRLLVRDSTRMACLDVRER